MLGCDRLQFVRLQLVPSWHNSGFLCKNLHFIPVLSSNPHLPVFTKFLQYLVELTSPSGRVPLSDLISCVSDLFPGSEPFVLTAPTSGFWIMSALFVSPFCRARFSVMLFSSSFCCVESDTSEFFTLFKPLSFFVD